MDPYTTKDYLLRKVLSCRYAPLHDQEHRECMLVKIHLYNTKRTLACVDEPLNDKGQLVKEILLVWMHYFEPYTTMQGKLVKETLLVQMQHPNHTSTDSFLRNTCSGRCILGLCLDFTG